MVVLIVDSYDRTVYMLIYSVTVYIICQESQEVAFVIVWFTIHNEAKYG